MIAFAIQESPLFVNIEGSTAVTEGNPMTFTLTASCIPSSVLTMILGIVAEGTADANEAIGIGLGTLAYGVGELQQTLSRGMESEHDLEQVTASAGVRDELFERPPEKGGLTVTLVSEATVSHIEADDDDATGLGGATADTERLRMGLEWSWQRLATDRGRIVPAGHPL